MKVLGPQIWVITPKNEGHGFPLNGMILQDIPTPLFASWEPGEGLDAGRDTAPSGKVEWQGGQPCFKMTGVGSSQVVYTWNAKCPIF